MKKKDSGLNLFLCVNREKRRNPKVYLLLGKGANLCGRADRETESFTRMKLKEWTRSPTTKSHKLESMGVNELEIQIPEKMNTKKTGFCGKSRMTMVWLYSVVKRENKTDVLFFSRAYRDLIFLGVISFSLFFLPHFCSHHLNSLIPFCLHFQSSLGSQWTE